MSDSTPPELLDNPEVLDATDDTDAEKDGVDETVDHPAKVMRIGTMMKQLLEEVRSATLDEASRDRLREIYATSVEELGGALSPDLQSELSRLALPFDRDATPSSAELQIAKAQLVGWLEGLVQGMQAMLFAQQMAAQQQLQTMRGQLPSGRADGVDPGEERPGTYL
ncbi:MAG: proteasome activator [Acidimicrobiales bacterium]|nr:proteasome activator [Acidimicrobiales bacterium]